MRRRTKSQMLRGLCDRCSTVALPGTWGKEQRAFCEVHRDEYLQSNLERVKALAREVGEKRRRAQRERGEREF